MHIRVYYRLGKLDYRVAPLIQRVIAAVLVVSLLIGCLIFIARADHEHYELSLIRKYTGSEAILLGKDSEGSRVRIESFDFIRIDGSCWNSFLSMAHFHAPSNPLCQSGSQKEKLLATLYPFHSFP